MKFLSLAAVILLGFAAQVHADNVQALRAMGSPNEIITRDDGKVFEILKDGTFQTMDMKPISATAAKFSVGAEQGAMVLGSDDNAENLTNCSGGGCVEPAHWGGWHHHHGGWMHWHHHPWFEHHHYWHGPWQYHHWHRHW